MDEKRPINRKGRGAVTNPTSRFRAQKIEAFDDGWPDEEPVNRIATVLTPEKTRTIITTNDSPDIPFNQSVDPYKGCEHGCIYCFARPGHAYLGLSPGLDFETKITFKPEAAERLDEELRKPNYRCDVIAMGSNTDPYQPAERSLKITRQVLEVLSKFNHPVSIVTKSRGILRDLDLLKSMAERRLISVMISITTLDPDLASKMEPRAASPAVRLETIRILSSAGIPTGVLASPMIPGLTDHELEAILEAAAEAGARQAAYILVHLPGETQELFSDWIRENYPLKAAKVLHLIRETRGGELNQKEFGVRMTGSGTYAELLRKRFAVARERLNLNDRSFRLDVTAFDVPPRKGDQMALSL